ncbi:MAG: hypothetical protein J6S67_10340 [Methanobrevibacter sp.]|nr:hypothetical protein [Methanobrevibacter sp.]
MSIIYKVMVNMWNGCRGIASDDNTEEYNGVEYTSRAEAELALQKARKETAQNMLVNYCYLDKIELYESEV